MAHLCSAMTDQSAHPFFCRLNRVLTVSMKELCVFGSPQTSAKTLFRLCRCWLIALHWTCHFVDSICPGSDLVGTVCWDKVIILAVSSENKVQASNASSFYTSEKPLHKLLELFHFKRMPTSCRGAVRAKVSSFQKVTILLQYKLFQIHFVHENNFCLKM